MKILVTAGNTQTPIDQVRCITNVFSGRTGTWIAIDAHRRGHDVRLLTSHPEVVADLAGPSDTTERWCVGPYRTFADLRHLMEQEIVGGSYDAIVHVAAVCDYEVAGTYALPPETTIDPTSYSLAASGRLAFLDAGAGKVKSHHPEVWLRLTPTPKLVDLIRDSWGFRGILVKFKLEVGVPAEELQRIADASRRYSRADAIVANTLEGISSWALIGSEEGFVQVDRKSLSAYVIQTIARLALSSSSQHGVPAARPRHRVCGEVQGVDLGLGQVVPPG